MMPRIKTVDIVSEQVWNFLATFKRLTVELSPAILRQLSHYLEEQLNFLIAHIHICEGVEALKLGRALLAASMLLDSFPIKKKEMVNFLKNHVDFQILQDGTHISRSPFQHFEAFWCLLDCKILLQKTTPEATKFLQLQLDKMGMFLRLMRYGDGSLGLFQGGYMPSALFVQTLLKKADCIGLPGIRTSNYSGYFRIETENFLLLFDAGGIPKPRGDFFPQASPLSFELCYGSQRIIVNSGNNPDLSKDWPLALSQTKAQSTIHIDDKSLLELDKKNIPRWKFFVPQGLMERGTTDPKDNPNDQPEKGFWIRTFHSGFQEGTIERTIFTTQTAPCIKGRDSITLSKNKNPKKSQNIPKNIFIRFHLHPKIEATLVPCKEATHPDSVSLLLPKGETLLFSTDQGTVTLEESVHLGRLGWPEPTTQIVIRLPLESARHHQVFWQLSLPKKD